MIHRGVTFTIRTGIAHHEWGIVVELPSERTVEKTVHGSRKAAETAAHGVIDRWLERHPPPIT